MGRSLILRLQMLNAVSTELTSWSKWADVYIKFKNKKSRLFRASLVSKIKWVIQVPPVISYILLCQNQMFYEKSYINRINHLIFTTANLSKFCHIFVSIGISERNCTQFWSRIAFKERPKFHSFLFIYEYPQWKFQGFHKSCSISTALRKFCFVSFQVA